MENPTATKEHWTDSWAWHLAAWVLTLFCAPVGVACIVVGIIRAAQGRGHGLWMSAVAAFAVSVVLSLMIRANW